MPSAGPYYSYAQLEYLWISNGGDPAVAPIMAAIALGESGGGSGSTNPTDSNGSGGSQTSWGLWQISNGTHNQPVDNILDPNVNARAAVGKYAGGKFQPWGVYTSGAYRKYLQEGVPPVSAGVPAGGSGAAVGGGAGATEAGFFKLADTCLIGIPGFGTAAGTVCIVTKTEARAVVGGLVLLVSSWIGTIGLAAIFVSVGLRAIPSNVANVIPGPLGDTVRTGKALQTGGPIPTRPAGPTRPPTKPAGK